MTNLREELRLSVADLTWTPPEDGILNNTTENIEPQEDIIGQDRAVKAIKRGLAMNAYGYNVYVSGYNGTGRMATVKRLLDEFNVEGPIPDDLCYVNNFKNPSQPRLIALKAGEGRKFKTRMNDLVNSLKKKIPAIFESEEFQTARNEIVNRHMGAQKALFKNFENKVNQQNFMMVQVQVGPFTRPDLAPVVVGNPMKIDQLEQLVEEGKFSADELARIKQQHKELSQEMEKIFKAARDIEKTIQEDLEKLSKDWVHPFIKEVLNPVHDEFTVDSVRAYLDEIEDDTVNHLDRFRPKLVTPQGAGGEAVGPPMLVPPDPTQFRDYEVNLLVDNSDTTKPPVVIEMTPTFRNLFGTVERAMDRSGMWLSDYLHIKAGSFLNANGGYLILNAKDAILEAGVWPALKRKPSKFLGRDTNRSVQFSLHVSAETRADPNQY